MRLAVFGASGQTGQVFLPLALARGHDVTALVRPGSAQPAAHERLRVVAGDVLVQSDLPGVVRGQDAVVILLGRPLRRAGQLRSRGTAHIVEAMRSKGATRVLCLATFGYGDGAPMLQRASFAFRHVVAPLLLGDTFADHARQEAVLRQSDLDWTIIRAPELTNGPGTGLLKTDIDRTRDPVRPVTRADLAELLLEILENGSHIRSIVSVSS